MPQLGTSYYIGRAMEAKFSSESRRFGPLTLLALKKRFGSKILGRFGTTFTTNIIFWRPLSNIIQSFAINLNV